MTPQPPFTDVRMKGFRERSSVAAVLQLISDRIHTLPGTLIPLSAAAGRVLSGAIVSTVNVPSFDRAAMDGFAVRAEDTIGASPVNPVSFVLVGEALPARPFHGVLGPGQAVRIVTGAPIPAGATAVLMAEFAQADPESGRIFGREQVAPGRHVSRVGEDVAQGSEVLAPGRRLRPQDLGLLASIGVQTVPVISRPLVAVLVTGTELIPPGSIPRGYQIVDSNTPMLAALISRDGGEQLPVRYLTDDLGGVTEGIREAAGVADVVLVSGGSSVGIEDHAPRAVAELGELPIHGVAIRPAGPLGVGFVSNAPGGRVVPVFLLPGNPVSCLCAYDLFAARGVRRMGGHSWEVPYRATLLPLADRLTSAVGRMDYVRVKVQGGQVIPIAASGASILSSTVTADGFVLVSPERESLAAGEVVEVWLYG